MSDPHSRWGDLEVLEESCYGGIWWCISRGYLSINGYVEVPKGLVVDDEDVDVHGGITYRTGQIIGFDTSHAGDYCPEIMDIQVAQGLCPARHRDALRDAATRVWTHKTVKAEVKNLAGQVSWLYAKAIEGGAP